jgi:hypothetical protein
VEGQNLCIFYLSPFQLYSVPTVIYLFSLYRAKCQKIFEHEKFPLCELNIALGSQYVCRVSLIPHSWGGRGEGGGHRISVWQVYHLHIGISLQRYKIYFYFLSSEAIYRGCVSYLVDEYCINCDIPSLSHSQGLHGRTSIYMSYMTTVWAGQP